VSSSESFVAREAGEGFADLRPYVDRARLRRLLGAFGRGADPTVSQAVWQAAALNGWVRNFRTTRYDPPPRANGPAAITPALSAGRWDYQN
jgi:hypothetical protein